MSRPRGKATGPFRSAHLIAVAARRLVDGRDPDPESALRHAAREAGIIDSTRLPPSADVVEAACAERRIFGGPVHFERLRRLRHIALDAMRFLADFSPCLVGSVLEGWAGSGAGVDLQVFTDDREALQLRLSELGIQPRVENLRRGHGDATYGHERLHFLAGDVPITLAIFPTDGVRRRTTAQGRSRATVTDLEALMSEAQPLSEHGSSR
jgi:hypothetical protein